MKNVTLHTPRDPALSAGLVAFEVAGAPNDRVVAKLLEKKIIASTAPYRDNYPRLAPSLVNDEAEVDAALRAVREMAGA
jgi:selenocysteine lyase/cysteine desulfurase